MGVSRQAVQQRFGEETINTKPLVDTQAEKIITRDGVTAFNERDIMDEEARNGRQLVSLGF